MVTIKKNDNNVWLYCKNSQIPSKNNTGFYGGLLIAVKMSEKKIL